MSLVAGDKAGDRAGDKVESMALGDAASRGGAVDAAAAAAARLDAKRAALHCAGNPARVRVFGVGVLVFMGWIVMG